MPFTSAFCSEDVQPRQIRIPSSISVVRNVPFNTHYAGADLFIPVVLDTDLWKNIPGIRRPIRACRKVIAECRPNAMYKSAVSTYMHVKTPLSTGQQNCIITLRVGRHHFYAEVELFLWREVPIADTVAAFARCYALNSDKA